MVVFINPVHRLILEISSYLAAHERHTLILLCDFAHLRYKINFPQLVVLPNESTKNSKNARDVEAVACHILYNTIDFKGRLMYMEDCQDYELRLNIQYIIS